ncbi:MAG: DUF5694 domain-containing protein [Acidobacteriota bacterium]
MKTARILAVLTVSSLLAVQTPLFGADAKTPVMVLGTFHLDNPGRDVHNFEADDVLSEKRQQEIEEVVAQLAEFRPTKICVEVPLLAKGEGQAQDRKHSGYTERYTDYLAGTMEEDRNEVYQIGFRLAKRLGHERIYPVDADSPWSGFRFGAVQESARKHGLSKIMEDGHAKTQAILEQLQELQTRGSVGDLLRAGNDPEMLITLQQGYTDVMARISADEDYIGPDQVSNWFGRNLRIYANVDRLAEPGDRILVIFGAGHAYYLRQFFGESARYELVDVSDYL